MSFVARSLVGISILFAHSTALADPIAVGAKVRINEVDTADTYYASRQEVLGRVCTVQPNPLTEVDGWYTGTVTCENGVSYAFYRVRIGPETAQVTNAVTAPATAPTSYGETLAERTTFRVLDIHSEDAYFSDRETMVGIECSADAELSEMEPGYYAGSATCSNGADSYYFYKAAIEVLSTPEPNTSTGALYGGNLSHIRRGAVVEILDISSEDAFSAWKDELVGQVCTVKGKAGLDSSGDNWFAGNLKCDTGKLYFYQVSVLLRDY